MIKYRNVRHGSIVERHAADEWLEASAGWERLDEPAPRARRPKADPATPADDTPVNGDDERTDDNGGN